MLSANTIKEKADKTIGSMNRGTQYLLNHIDPANKNLFQFILYPKMLDDVSLMSAGGGALLGLAEDTLIAQVYLRSVDISFLSLEYEAHNEIKVPKKITFPDTITIMILENEFGYVGNYLYRWVNRIVFPVHEKDPQSSLSRVNYVWTDNQEAAKKNATLIPQSGIGLPANRFIRMYGLKYQSIESITYGHGEADPLIYNLTCSVDSVWFKPLF